VGSHVAVEHARARRRLARDRADVVLDCDGNAAKRGIAWQSAGVERCGAASYLVAGDLVKRVKVRIEPGDGVERVRAHGDGRGLAARNRGADFAGVPRWRHDPMTRGTVKSPASASPSGASRSRTSRSRGGRGASSSNGAAA